MPFPNIVITHGEFPIYLQIKYQLLHLISSGALPEGYRLPPVRAFAEHLNINPGTIAQAYKELQSEGLIKGEKGRGTFVKSISNVDLTDYAVRQQLFTSSLEDLLDWAYALGLSDVDIQQNVTALLSRKTLRRPMVFVGYYPLDSKKYAEHLTDYLLEFQLDVSATTITALEAEEDITHFKHVYYVFTFAGLVQRVEEALKQFDRPYRVVGIVSEVTASTVRALSELPANTNAILLAEKHYVHSALNLIQRYSRIAIEDISTLYNGQTDNQDLIAKADIILYSLGMREKAEKLKLLQGRCIELAFDISEDSLLKLKRMFAPTAQATWAP